MAPGEEEKGPSVAVAVSGRRSRAAVIWASQHIFPLASSALLLHVVPSLPPSSDQLSEQANRRESKVQALQQVLPFKKLCGPENQAEIVFLDGADPASALLRYVAAADIDNLVLGGTSLTWFKRILRRPDVGASCLRSSQRSCNIFIVSRIKITAKMVNNSVANVAACANSLQLNGYDTSTCGILGCQSLYSFSWRRLICSVEESKAVDHLSPSDTKFKEIHPMLLASSSQRSQSEDIKNAENAKIMLQSTLTTYDEAFEGLLARSGSTSVDLEEIESLRQKLRVTLAAYEEACENLTHSKLKVQKLSEDWLEKSRRVKDAILREEVLKRIVAEERRRHSEAVNEVKQARETLEREVAERIKAEDHANEQSMEKLKFMEAVLERDMGYKRFSKEEIIAATDNFSPEKKIGHGGFGSVYKGFLDHTPVAIKVLREDAAEKMEEFMREVAFLKRLHHPNIVLLLGACPEIGCIVYEYVHKGSLQDNLFPPGDAPPLPCHVRFRILFHVARALSFLHSAPSPVIHRDLKPDNILLSDRYVAKISDVGLAKFAPDLPSDYETFFADTVVAGTVHYVDPEYQLTGALRPKSDLYAFGVICMQMLTGRSPAGIISAVEKATMEGRVSKVLDPAAGEWPVAAAEDLAALALKCCEMRCRDRPELQAEVLPELERLVAAADAFAQASGSPRFPARYLCPILQEPMEDPHVAADGFTYEYRAISAWLRENQTSPVTGLPLPDKTVIPNHSLRLAIQGRRISGSPRGGT